MLKKFRKNATKTVNSLKKHKIIQQISSANEKRIAKFFDLYLKDKSVPYQLPHHKSERESLILNTYLSNGINGLIGILEKDQTNSKMERSKVYLEAGQIVKKHNKYDAYLLCYMANGLYKSETTCRALGWAALHAKELEIAQMCVQELDEFYQKEGDVQHKKLAERLKLSVSKAVEVLRGDAIKASSIKISYKQDEVVSETFEEHRVDVEFLLALYKQSTREKVVAVIQNSELKQKEKAQLCIQLSKHFRELFKIEQSVYFADQALFFDESATILRGVYWAYKRAGEQSKTDNVLKKLEQNMLTLSRKEQDAIKKLRANYNSTYSVLKVLEDLKSVRKQYPEHAPIKNRICYVLHNSLPYASGGYATRGHGLAKGFLNHGFDIKVVNRPGFPYETKPELDELHPPKLEQVDGVDYIKISQPRRGVGLTTADYIGQATEALLQEFLELKPEIIIGASNYLTALPALLAARKLGIPFIYEVRGFWEITRLSREPEFAHHPSFKIQVEMESAVVKAADHVFTLTNAMKDELVKRGADISKITLIPNSCNPEQFIPRTKDVALMQKLSFPENIPVIGYIGTFVIYEGLEYLAEACGKLKQRGIEFRLLLVGNENTAGTNRGEITEMIAQTVEKYGFTDWLVMPGRIPFKEVESYYSIIDIVPFPRKPWPVCEMVSPMKPLEALAMEKAIVVSSVGALAEMVNPNETGVVFRKGDIDDLADKLQMLISNPDLCKIMGKNGRMWVEHERTWQKTSDKASSMLKLVLDGK
uniref:WnmB n=1 Tax=Neisseria meningitidis TaxID=487 RepID=H6T602_NEIME|nr:WnmB [Neisseria meningitidis]